MAPSSSRRCWENCGRDIERAHLLEAWLEEIATAFGDRILPIDGAVADEWGRMSALRPVPVVDGLLVATARAHRMTLVTRNARDVEGLGVRVLDPFRD
jgi:toxin FitB